MLMIYDDNDRTDHDNDCIHIVIILMVVTVCNDSIPTKFQPNTLGKCGHFSKVLQGMATLRSPGLKVNFLVGYM